MIKNVKWFHVSVPCETAAFEAVSNFLFDQGANGVEELDQTIIGYFGADSDNKMLKHDLDRFLDNLKEMGFSVGQPIIAERPVEDWSAGWRRFFHPMRITEKIVVKPPWEVLNAPQSILIDIMPRMAFGTGSHETTRICLELLEKYIRRGDHILDMGTGSGILAIAAAKLGARCIAVDTDSEALENARENVSLNSVSDRIEILQGSIEVVPMRPYDLILANINRSVLSEILRAMIALCRPKTRMVLSGVLISEYTGFLDQMQAVGLSCIERRESGEWIGLVAGMRH
ncbi:50S ribosomal protein L11 methyltransferase [bacterium]|nr:50S ribosomal protein L11 methyltransferase [bacterium]